MPATNKLTTQSKVLICIGIAVLLFGVFSIESAYHCFESLETVAKYGGLCAISATKLYYTYSTLSKLLISGGAVMIMLGVFNNVGTGKDSTKNPYFNDESENKGEALERNLNKLNRIKFKVNESGSK